MWPKFLVWPSPLEYSLSVALNYYKVTFPSKQLGLYCSELLYISTTITHLFCEVWKVVLLL